MPVEIPQRLTISDDPEPAFMVTIREWNSYIGRIRRLADPLDHPYGWAQVCGGIAVAMIFSTLSLPNRDDHPYLFGLNLGTALAACVLTAFFFWLGKRQKVQRPETVESIVKDMERHRDAKAPESEDGFAGIAGQLSGRGSRTTSGDPHGLQG